MRCTLHHIEDVASSIKTFWFTPEHPVEFMAGQYANWHVKHDADDLGQDRWFTISSSPTEKLISFTTKFSEFSSSFKYTLLTLQPGATVEMASPIGGFVLPKDETQPLVFVAGGIGVTPFRSMVTWLRDTKQKRSITLLYAANHENELAFTDLFTDYGMAVIPIIFQPSNSWHGETGRATPERIIELAKLDTLKNARVYLSGPEPMIHSLQQGLIAQGIATKSIATDFFPGYIQGL